MNRIKIISANDQTLPVIAGEVLVTNNPCYNCLHVKESTCNQVFRSVGDTGPCEDYFPMPISLTWSEAMKWRDWAVEKYGRVMFARMLYKSMREATGNTHYELKALCDAKPIHYIKAACLCAKKGDSDG